MAIGGGFPYPFKDPLDSPRRTPPPPPPRRLDRPRFLPFASASLGRATLRGLVVIAAGSLVVLGACANNDEVLGGPPSIEAGAVSDAGSTTDARTFEPRPQDAAPGSCSEYCDLLDVSCTGAHAQYMDRAQCVAVCETLPTGSVGARSGNTVACRQTYAGNVAKTDPARYCPVAGPFGGGICGERCDSFCAIALAICPKTPWATLPTCVSACTNLRYVGTDAETGTQSGGEGLAGPMSGDTLNCRTRRLLEALTVPEQCDEIGVGGACSDPAPPRDR